MGAKRGRCESVMPNYENSYWKALEIREKIEQGQIKLCKRDAQKVCDLLSDVANAPFREAGVSP